MTTVMPWLQAVKNNGLLKPNLSVTVVECNILKNMNCELMLNRPTEESKLCFKT